MLALKPSALPGILLSWAGRNIRQQRRRSQIDCRGDLGRATWAGAPIKRRRPVGPGIRISDLH